MSLFASSDQTMLESQRSYAYEAAVNLEKLAASAFCAHRNNAPVEVELDVHIPTGTPNINEDWKIHDGPLRLVRSKWTWSEPGEAPVRATWDKGTGDWSIEGKAAGIDQVFASRLPKPFRIEALTGPIEEQRKLLKLIIEPIASKLGKLLDDPTTPVSIKLQEFMTASRDPVTEFNNAVQETQASMSQSYSRVFAASSLKLKIDVADLKVDATKSLLDGSSLKITEHDADFGIEQQGTGSQRTLFWSMLEVRSALQHKFDTEKGIADKKSKLQKDISKLRVKVCKTEAAAKKNTEEIATKEAELGALDGQVEDGITLPGYMLLIDEPEIALHPNAVRAAKSYLYELARAGGWQVMLTTHCPAFVDPTEDHTTIVRLTRAAADPSPKLFRSDDAQFSDDEKKQLRFLLQFDPTVAELFFGSYPILVEGDTEFAAFLAVMEANENEFPEGERPVIIRALGKALIVPLIKILQHFKLPFSIIHDADAPKKRNGTNNGMWTENWKIFAAISDCRARGTRVVHRVSIPDMERRMEFEEADGKKPFAMWSGLGADGAKMAACKELLKELVAGDSQVSEFDVQNYQAALTGAVRTWAEVNAKTDARFAFQ